MSGTVGSSVFSGNFSRSGEASGTWTNTAGDSGSFTGSRVLVTPTPGGDNSGTLSISGNDSNAIGVSFTPNLDPAIIDYGTGDIIVMWAQQIFSSTTFESRSMFFSFNENDDSLKIVGYIRATSTDPDADPTSLYSYNLDCETVSQSCSSVLLDASQRKATFNNTTLAAIGDSNSMGTIVLSGTLSW